MFMIVFNTFLLAWFNYNLIFFKILTVKLGLVNFEGLLIVYI